MFTSARASPPGQEGAGIGKFRAERGGPSSARPQPLAGWRQETAAPGATIGLTLLILHPRAPPAPVPHGGQGDDVPRDHEGRKQAPEGSMALEAPACVLGRRSRPSEGLLQAGSSPFLPRGSGGRLGVPGTGDRPLRDRPTTVGRRRRTNCAPARASCSGHSRSPPAPPPTAAPLRGPCAARTPQGQRSLNPCLTRGHTRQEEGPAGTPG